MLPEEKTILAVVPGTRRFGIAVLSGGELLHFAVQSVKLNLASRYGSTAQMFEEATGQILKTLVERFGANSLVIKEPNRQQQKSAGFRQVFECLKQEAERAQISFRTISFETVKKLFGSGHKPTKAVVFRKLAALFPELAQFVNHPSRWQRSYYTPLLLAAAVAVTCWHQTAKQN